MRQRPALGRAPPSQRAQLPVRGSVDADIGAHIPRSTSAIGHRFASPRRRAAAARRRCGPRGVGPTHSAARATTAPPPGIERQEVVVHEVEDPRAPRSCTAGHLLGQPRPAARGRRVSPGRAAPGARAPAPRHATIGAGASQPRRDHQIGGRQPSGEAAVPRPGPGGCPPRNSGPPPCESPRLRANIAPGSAPVGRSSRSSPTSAASPAKRTTCRRPPGEPRMSSALRVEKWPPRRCARGSRAGLSSRASDSEASAPSVLCSDMPTQRGRSVSTVRATSPRSRQPENDSVSARNPASSTARCKTDSEWFSNSGRTRPTSANPCVIMVSARASCTARSPRWRLVRRRSWPPQMDTALDGNGSSEKE